MRRQEHLTAREKTILRLASLGYSDAQMAAEMRIRPNTVGTNLQRMREKLGRFERAHIAGLAMAMGLVTAEEVTAAAYDWFHANCPDLAELQGDEQRKQMQARIDAELYAG